MGLHQELLTLASAVLEHYAIEVSNLEVIQGEAIKSVWKVETPEKPLCLKRLRHSLDKLMFSIEAQRYIKARGGNVAGIIESKEGDPYLIWEEQVFVLYEWIDGSQLNFSKTEDFEDALMGLSRFHSFSNGFAPKAGVLVSSKLGKWPDQYQSMLRRLVEWKGIAQGQEAPSYNAYVSVVDGMIDLAKGALNHLVNSNYQELTASSSLPSVVLCHQDYGKGNALNTSDGVWVLDLDNVSFDLRARDLRKIILKTMENRGQWSRDVMEEILAAYEQRNPLTVDERKMVYIDTMFPHGFHGTVKNLFKKNKMVAPSEIQQVSRLEESKIDILESAILMSKDDTL